jgi:hypothetical protein
MSDLFAVASSIKDTVDSKRKGSSIPNASLIKLPYFKGNMKREVSGIKCLTAAFIMNYFTCLSACIVTCENTRIAVVNKTAKKADKLVPVSLSVYLVEAVLSSEGYLHSDYTQSSRVGHKAIKFSLLAFSKREKLNLSINDEGLISGLTTKVVNACIAAV